MKATVLLIDDDPVDIKALQLLLEEWGHEVLAARSGSEGIRLVETSPVDIVVADVRMPGMSGEDVARAISGFAPGLPVILITGYGDVRAAVRAMKLGAFDYVVKPPNPDEFRLTLERAIEHSRLRRENLRLRTELIARGGFTDRLIGESRPMAEILALIERVAPTDTTVLITGETGTGKELVARTIHARSRRAAGPFVALNCAAVNANLIESELFGHEKGAFTGAVAARRGRFEEADGGTLFLDEIAETGPDFQAKLLRVLQEREFERVGGNRPVKVDVRVLASTNRDLAAEVTAGRFREDLFYRLSVIPIVLPPLRERRSDIGALAGHFLTLYCERYGCPARTLSPDAVRRLEEREWRGNVRELQHAVERAVVMSRNETLSPDDFAVVRSEGRPEPSSAILRDFVEEKTREHVIGVLEQTGWRKQRAAELLGIDRATLYRLMRRYSVEK
jgi:DNA-binding NtrC family response regulator